MTRHRANPTRRLKRDLARFSAVVIAPEASLSPEQLRRLADYFVIAPRGCHAAVARWSHPAPDAGDVAVWAASLGFFPVLVLAGDARRYARAESEAVWICGAADIDRVLTSRHVVPCGPIDVASRIREFHHEL